MSRIKERSELTRARNLESAFLAHRETIVDETVKGSYFQLLNLRFDVERAHYLSQYHTAQNFGIVPIVKSWGLVNPVESMIRIDPKVLKALPKKALKTPIYLGDFLLREGESTRMLFDGWHRVTKAYSMGITELPAICFSPIETMWIMHELNIFTEA